MGCSLYLLLRQAHPPSMSLGRTGVATPSTTFHSNSDDVSCADTLCLDSYARRRHQPRHLLLATVRPSEQQATCEAPARRNKLPIDLPANCGASAHRHPLPGSSTLSRVPATWSSASLSLSLSLTSHIAHRQHGLPNPRHRGPPHPRPSARHPAQGTPLPPPDWHDS